MLKIGKNDRDDKQVRIEHTGKHTRASRTGGVSVRAEKKIGPVNLTANSSRGLRASTRISNGLRVAMQNGRFQLIGRWRSGPIALNLSKTGVSASFRNSAGAFNFLKPQYSSFKLAGVHIRGRKAAQFQFIYMIFIASAFIINVAVRFIIFFIWLIYLLLLFVGGLVTGFIRGARGT